MRIQTSNGRTFQIDEDDLPLVQQYRWRGWKIHKTVYIATELVGGKRLYLHRLLMNPQDGLEVDHINGDARDNRRSNLRVCTHSQNVSNQRTQKRGKYSRYKGVTKFPRNTKRPWIAQAKVMGKHIFLGYYKTQIEAARAYNKAAPRLFGEFARLNKI